jgi:hypothetical protein
MPRSSSTAALQQNGNGTREAQERAQKSTKTFACPFFVPFVPFVASPSAAVLPPHFRLDIIASHSSADAKLGLAIVRWHELDSRCSSQCTARLFV